MSQPIRGMPSERSDPLIDEVRAIREEISNRFGNDVERLCEHLREVEKAHTGPLIRPEDVVNLPPPAQNRTALEERPDPLMDEVEAIRKGRAENGG